LPKIEVLCSQHVEEKISSGEVHEELIANTLFTGERRLEQEPNKYLARKRFRKGTLAVVYKELFERLWVITAYWEEFR